MYCPECGKKIPDNENICPECGCNVSFESEAIRKKPVKKAGRGGGAIAAGIIAVAVGAAALEGAWFFLLSPKRAALSGASENAVAVSQTAPVNVAEITAAPLESLVVSAPAEADALPEASELAPQGQAEKAAAQTPAAESTAAPAASTPTEQADTAQAPEAATETAQQEPAAAAPAQPTTPPQQTETQETSQTTAAPEPTAAAKKTHNYYVIPSSSEKEVTTEMLDKLKPNQVRVARNEIYARHGYIFQSEDLNKFFNSQEWYTPVTSDIDSIELSDMEWRNIEFINDYEETHG